MVGVHRINFYESEGMSIIIEGLDNEEGKWDLSDFVKAHKK